MQLEIEREALKKEKDSASKDRLAKLGKEIESLKAETDEKKRHWNYEKDAIKTIRGLKEQIEAEKTLEAQPSAAAILKKSRRYATAPSLSCSAGLTKKTSA